MEPVKRGRSIPYPLYVGSYCGYSSVKVVTKSQVLEPVLAKPVAELQTQNLERRLRVMLNPCLLPALLMWLQGLYPFSLFPALPLDSLVVPL